MRTKNTLFSLIDTLEAKRLLVVCKIGLAITVNGLGYFQNGVLTKIDEQYRTNGYRIFSGLMGSGALGLYTLLNRPEMFDAYLIASPTLGGNFGNVVADAPSKLKTKYDGKLGNER